MSLDYVAALAAVMAFSVGWGFCGGRLYARALLAVTNAPKHRGVWLGIVLYLLFAVSLVGPWFFFFAHADVGHAKFLSAKFLLALAPPIVSVPALYHGLKPHLQELRARGLFK